MKGRRKLPLLLSACLRDWRRRIDKLRIVQRGWPGFNSIAPRWRLKGKMMEVSKLYWSEQGLVDMLVKHSCNVDTVDMITDKLASAGLCRPRGDVSGLGALRTESTLNALKGGHITEQKAAADLKRWGLM